jgi:hypothetical protein
MLAKAYNSFWSSVSTRDSEYIPITLGSKEDSALLDCMDWHPTAGSTPWEQSMVENNNTANGWWAVRFAHAGKYRIGLRRFPDEAGSLAVKALPAKNAKLQIGSQAYNKAVPAGASEVDFTVDVDSGQTTLQTWFTGGATTLGAYFVKVIDLEPSTSVFHGQPDRIKSSAKPLKFQQGEIRFPKPGHPGASVNAQGVTYPPTLPGSDGE